MPSQGTDGPGRGDGCPVAGAGGVLGLQGARANSAEGGREDSGSGGRHTTAGVNGLQTQVPVNATVSSLKKDVIADSSISSTTCHGLQTGLFSGIIC